MKAIIHAILFIALIMAFDLALGENVQNGSDIPSEQLDVAAENTDPINSEVAEQQENLKRDPFWPIDYDPLVNAAKDRAGGKTPDQLEMEKNQLERDWNEAQATISVSGVGRMGDEGYFAIINDQMIRSGDSVSIQNKGGLFVWKVSKIDQDGVKLKRMQHRME